jgi:hypothetical protein
MVLRPERFRISLRLSNASGVRQSISVTVGVCNSAAIGSKGSPNLFREWKPCEELVVVTVGNKPRSVSLVRRVNTASWQYGRLNGVAFSFQVSAHLLENHPSIPISNAKYIFAHNPARSDFSNCS